MGTVSRNKGENIVPLWRIICCTFAMCGIQVCYAAQINFGTAQLLFLGLAEESVSIAWLAGPVSGLIVQPLIGVCSDSCTSKLGRRRPFLIVGTFFTVIALILFSNARNVAEIITYQSLVPRVALIVAVFSFFLLDFSIQAIQAPLRALVTDIIPKSQRTLANSYIGMFTGLGNLLGGVLASVTLTDYFKIFDNDVQALFSISAFLVSFSVFITCVFAKEERLASLKAIKGEQTDVIEEEEDTEKKDLEFNEESALLTEVEKTNRGNYKYTIWQSLRNIPSPFWKVFCVQLCTWCGFFTLFVYLNAWIGTNVFNGDGSASRSSPLRARFEEGVQLGGKGNAIMALVTLLFSLLLPSLVKKVGVLKVYTLSQVTEAFCLLLAPAIRSRNANGMPSALLKNITLMNVSMFGIVWAVTMTVPWTLIGDALESDPKYSSNIGIYTTLFNASQSFPQLVVALVSPFILSISNDDSSYVMLTGGIFALLGAYLVVLLRIGGEKIQNHNSNWDLKPKDAVEAIGNRHRKLISPDDLYRVLQKTFDDDSALLRHVSSDRVWIQ